MKKPEIFGTALLISALAVHGCKTPEEVVSDEERRAAQAKISASTREEAKTVLEPPKERSIEEREAEYRAFERKARDELFDDILKEQDYIGPDFRLLESLRSLRQRYSYGVKPNLKERKTFGPKFFLFDLRPVGFFRKPPFLDPSALFDDFVIGNGAFKQYRKSIAEKRKTLNLQVEEDQPKFKPFYESVRNPSEEDLVRLYTILRKIPPFILKAFEKGYGDDFRKAWFLFAQEQQSQRDLHFYKSANPRQGRGSYLSGLKDPAHPFPLRQHRKANGELVIKNPDETHREDAAVFDGDKEFRTSPFAKWLFRRGFRFTTNARVMLDAFWQAQNVEDFVKIVREKIPRE